MSHVGFSESSFAVFNIVISRRSSLLLPALYLFLTSKFALLSSFPKQMKLLFGEEGDVIFLSDDFFIFHVFFDSFLPLY